MTDDQRRAAMLVSTDELRSRLGDPALRIFDCSTYLVRDPVTTYREVTGEEDWRREHIPGAAFLDIPNELSDKSSGLRLTMPQAEVFASRMAGYGVSDDSSVVLYSAGQIMWATRVWWMLRSIGFDRARVLDGGYRKWQAEGGPVSSEAVRYAPGNLTARPRPETFADRHAVLAAIGAADATIVNALPPEQHRGESDVNHGRPGRIADSVNVNAFDLIEPDSGTFKPVAQMKTLFESQGVIPQKRTICYCGGGISATGDAFALVMAGYPDVAVYDGSMNEWAKDPTLPMQTGA